MMASPSRFRSASSDPTMSNCALGFPSLFCQRELCQQVLDQGGDYLLVVKDNQPALKEAISAEFAADFSPGKPAAA